MKKFLLIMFIFITTISNSLIGARNDSSSIIVNEIAINSIRSFGEGLGNIDEWNAYNNESGIVIIFTDLHSDPKMALNSFCFTLNLTDYLGILDYVIEGYIKENKLTKNKNEWFKVNEDNYKSISKYILHNLIQRQINWREVKLNPFSALYFLRDIEIYPAESEVNYNSNSDEFKIFDEQIEPFFNVIKKIQDNGASYQLNYHISISIILKQVENLFDNLKKFGKDQLADFVLSQKADEIVKLTNQLKKEQQITSDQIKDLEIIENFFNSFSKCHFTADKRSEEMLESTLQVLNKSKVVCLLTGRSHVGYIREELNKREISNLIFIPNGSKGKSNLLPKTLANDFPKYFSEAKEFEYSKEQELKDKIIVGEDIHILSLNKCIPHDLIDRLDDPLNKFLLSTYWSKNRKDVLKNKKEIHFTMKDGILTSVLETFRWKNEVLLGKKRRIDFFNKEIGIGLELKLMRANSAEDRIYSYPFVKKSREAVIEYLKNDNIKGLIYLILIQREQFIDKDGNINIERFKTIQNKLKELENFIKKDYNEGKPIKIIGKIVINHLIEEFNKYINYV